MITHPQVEEYIQALIPERSPVLKRLEHECEADGIPNLLLSSAQFMRFWLRSQKPARILEIGTAIGYSAITMAEACPEAKIVTIERDEERAGRAMSNLREAGVSGRVQLMEGDALDLIPTLRHFDFIFIDAAKGQYPKFLELSLQKLEPNGVILTDNVLFRGWVAQEGLEGIESKHHRMIEKLKGYNRLLANHTELETTFIPMGDGLALSRRKPN
jgi:predicted O-methyltransferase YrrM